MEYDWQCVKNIKERGCYLYKTGKWADCSFSVDMLSSRVLSGHKVILASASPVFSRMFYGDLREKNDPIPISDADPDAFQAMLEFIYTEEVNFTSFGEACELYCVGNKYSLPSLIELCVAFILKDLSPENACRAYEMGKVFDNTKIMEQSMTIIIQKTDRVLSAPSFLDIKSDTLMMILDQDKLTIDSELDLVDGLLKYANKHNLFAQNNDKLESSSLYSPLEQQQEKKKQSAESLQQEAADSPVDVKETAVEPTLDTNACGSKANTPEESSLNVGLNIEDNPLLLRQAVRKIRFLSLTTSQFAKGAGRSKLLQPSEALTFILKISNPFNSDPMPAGFCSSRTSRNHRYSTISPVVISKTCRKHHTLNTNKKYYYCEECEEHTPF